MCFVFVWRAVNLICTTTAFVPDGVCVTFAWKVLNGVLKCFSSEGTVVEGRCSNTCCWFNSCVGRAQRSPQRCLFVKSVVQHVCSMMPVDIRSSKKGECCKTVCKMPLQTRHDASPWESPRNTTPGKLVNMNRRSRVTKPGLYNCLCSR